jgi:hypothetical protein
VSRHDGSDDDGGRKRCRGRAISSQIPNTKHFLLCGLRHERRPLPSRLEEVYRILQLHVAFILSHEFHHIPFHRFHGASKCPPLSRATFLQPLRCSRGSKLYLPDPLADEVKLAEGIYGSESRPTGVARDGADEELDL